MTVKAEILPSSGLVLVYSGLRNAVASDDELAAVLSHEIAHVLANHSKNDAIVHTIAFGISVPFAMGTLLGLIIAEFMLFALPLIPIWAPVFYVSWKHEKEADYIGMMLMADAGFDPSAMISIGKKMKQMNDRMWKETEQMINRMEKKMEDGTLNVEMARQDLHLVAIHPYVS